MKKRIFIALFCITLFPTSFAATKDFENDITMVSYEQTWSDREGTIALKNNTSEEIKNVVFLLTYLDMSGTELDYKEFSKEITIAPGMTRKLDVEAYEYDRHYHYYKSEGLYDNTSFKVIFQLKDYNVDSKEITKTKDTIGSYELFIIFFLPILGIFIGLFILVGVLAKKRNRNVALWVLLAIIVTPLFSIIILLCIGNKERRSMDKIS